MPLTLEDMHLEFEFRKQDLSLEFSCFRLYVERSA